MNISIEKPKDNGENSDEPVNEGNVNPSPVTTEPINKPKRKRPVKSGTVVADGNDASEPADTVRSGGEGVVPTEGTGNAKNESPVDANVSNGESTPVGATGSGEQTEVKVDSPTKGRSRSGHARQVISKIVYYKPQFRSGGVSSISHRKKSESESAQIEDSESDPDDGYEEYEDEEGMSEDYDDDPEIIQRSERETRKVSIDKRSKRGDQVDTKKRRSGYVPMRYYAPYKKPTVFTYV